VLLLVLLLLVAVCYLLFLRIVVTCFCWLVVVVVASLFALLCMFYSVNIFPLCSITTIVSKVINVVVCLCFHRGFRSIFEHIKVCVAKTFPGDNRTTHVAPSGFVFLRFFCPALLGPKLFGLADGSSFVSFCFKIFFRLFSFLFCFLSI